MSWMWHVCIEWAHPWRLTRQRVHHRCWAVMNSWRFHCTRVTPGEFTTDLGTHTPVFPWRHNALCRESSFFLFSTGNSSHVRDVLELSLSYSVGMLVWLSLELTWSCGTCEVDTLMIRFIWGNKNPPVTFHENTGWLIHLGPYSGFL